VNHYVINDVNIEAPRRKNAQAMDFEKQWTPHDGSHSHYCRVKPLHVTNL
jgi:hypothetical protein